MAFGFNIRDVAKMFADANPDISDNSDNEDEPDRRTSHANKKGPGDILTKSKNEDDYGHCSRDAGPKGKDSVTANPKHIWDKKEVGDTLNEKDDAFDRDNIAIKNDPRPTPTYEIYYRQAVRAQDMFLQTGNKTPATASCENLVVEVHLPGDDIEEIQLNVKKQAIDIRSPNHFLYLTLPHQVDPRAGNAKWDREKEKLIVTLHRIRELDEANF